MANEFLTKLGIEIPILQAPVGGAATVELASEVARAGGMGSLALTWTDPGVSTAQVRNLRQRAGQRFFVNYVLRFVPLGLDAALAADAPAMTLSWGIDVALMAKIKSRGALLGVQVGNAAGAKAAADAGADFIIAQGVEAGGHVQSSRPLAQLLPDAIAAAHGVPVVAAGGMATAKDIRAALDQGAAAVMLGTRFLATPEAAAHAAYKDALVAARAADTVFTNCFDIDWPYAMVRVLRNSTFEAWEAAGCPAAPNRPGEGDAVAHHSASPIIRYSDTPPSCDASGDVLAACLYAGQGVGGIDSIEPAYQLVTRLWREASQL